MNREIKFKFVIESHGEKYISRPYILDENGLPGHEEILEDMEECTCSLNESVNVCEGDCLQFEDAVVVDKLQFTGLLDKNKKEIYKDDIIDLYGEIGVVEYGEQSISHDWVGIGFYVKNESRWQHNIYGGEGTELLGNIYKNKDMIPLIK